MAFPFFPGGLLLALAVLGGAFAIFGLVLRLLDRVAGSARESIAPSLVSGLRTWSGARPRSRDATAAADSWSPQAPLSASERPVITAGSSEPELAPFELVDLDGRPDDLPLEAVRRTARDRR